MSVSSLGEIEPTRFPDIRSSEEELSPVSYQRFFILFFLSVSPICFALNDAFLTVVGFRKVSVNHEELLLSKLSHFDGNILVLLIS